LSVRRFYVEDTHKTTQSLKYLVSVTVSMIEYVKQRIRAIRLKRTFAEYGFTIKNFIVEGFGKVDYAQWLHPLEEPKEITESKIGFYRKLVSPGALVIDIGAHTGDTTVPMSLAAGKTGVVIALEPNPYVFKVLEKNAQLNGDLATIHPYCFAATDVDGEFIFDYSDASFCNGGYLSQLSKRRHGHKYQLTVVGKNLENFLLMNYQRDLHKLQLVKIDAEGYDKQIVKSISGILKQYKPALMAECYRNLSYEERIELFDTISDLGYELFRLENFEENGKRLPIRKENMMDERHFELLAVAKE
jgi:FkbM family methyltransferase